MMKKCFYSLLAATGMLLATSCSQDDLANEISSESKVVTFKVNVPKQFESRAIGDGGGANKLIYAMYEEGTSTPLIQNTADRKTDATFEVKVPMAKDIQYDLLFLAYNPEHTAFVIADEPKNTNLKALKFKNELDANQDYDAFVGQLISQGITASGQTSVTLYRPFAQINAATIAEDFRAAKDTLKSEVKTSEFTIYNVPGTYDVTTGLASDSINVVFKKADIPSSDKLTVNGKEYTYLTLAYVLAGDSTNSSTHQADFTFQRTSDGKQVSSLSFLHFPIQRNYRTNVIGRLLTELESYKVEIDNDFGTVSDEHIMSPDSAYRVYHVTSNAEWNDVAEIMASEEQDTLTVKLGAGMGRSANEIIASGVTTIHKNKTVFLDLNGYTLLLESENQGDAMFVNGGRLTITDSSKDASGKISFTYSGAFDTNFSVGNYTIANSGQLVVENGTIEAKAKDCTGKVSHALYVIDNKNNSTLTINGGKIYNANNYAIRQFGSSSVTVNGGEIEGIRAFWMQAPGSDASTAPVINLSVNGGILTAIGEPGDYKLAIYSTSNGNSLQNVAIKISNGVFNGDVALTGGSNKNNVETLEISGGIFDGGVYSYAEPEKATGKISISGGTFTKNPTSFLADGYTVEEENGNYKVVEDEVVMIGSTTYSTLEKTIEAASNGETITFIKDVEQTDGVIITDKSLTIDLNGKTFTVTEGASTNNRNFKINGSSVVTIKNGTMVAKGDYSSGAYGTLRTEGTANVTLKDVKLYNYRGNGLNVKALSGTTVTISDSEVYSQYGGGIEAAGGIIELTNVKVEQKGMYTAPYNSMAISVNGGGTVIVNSGTYTTECLTAEEANNQGTSHGPWAAGVLNSGGTLIIKGGTFSNNNFGENSLATYARGLLLADTGANIQIKGGTFNALDKIVDIQNNLGDASKNPKATISGGNFSVDPLTWDGLITIAEGYKVVENAGVWNVVVDPAAKIGSTEYATLQEAFNVGGEITLLRNVTLAETAVLAEGKTVVLDLNEMTISGYIPKSVGHILKNEGNLTIKGGKIQSLANNGGSAIYNNGTLVVNNTEIIGAPKEGSSWPSYAVNNYGELSLNKVKVTSNHGSISAYGKTTLENCEVTLNGMGGSSHVFYVGGEGTEVIVNGGTYIHKGNTDGSLAYIMTGTTFTVNDGTFKASNGGYGLATYTGKLYVNGGTFANVLMDWGGPISITGGTFPKEQNKKYIANGYEARDNSDGTWTAIKSE